MAARSTEEIENVIGIASETESESRWPAATYEQGVIEALKWVLGQQDTSPIEDA